MKCIDAVYLAYLQTYEDLFCLSKYVDSDGKSTLEISQNDEHHILNDEILFAGESEQYFSMTIKADNYDRFFQVIIEIPVVKNEQLELLKFANKINLEAYPASISLNDAGDKFLVQSQINLSKYGLVRENNDEPDNHSGFFYAVEAAKEQLLATTRMGGSAVRALEHFGWMARRK